MMAYLLRTNWWKYLTAALLYYTMIGGLLFDVPMMPILLESIRNVHFHVPMWFAMMLLFLVAHICSIRYLRSGQEVWDLYASKLVLVTAIFGILGIFTGIIWARNTWGEGWSNDPKQNASAAGLILILAQIVLRGSVEDISMRRRIFAVYNIFSFWIFLVLILVLPRLTDSLHPGSGGNPGFNAYDLDSRLRMVFYPAVLGWTLLGLWITALFIRMQRVSDTLEDGPG